MKWRGSFVNSFKVAVQGIGHTIRTERNIKFQLAAAAAVIAGGLFFSISRIEWLFIGLAITLVLSAELMNTAVEKTVDLVTDEEHPLAKIAKDAAAGAVLITAAFAVIVGLVIFYQPIVQWLFS